MAHCIAFYGRSGAGKDYLAQHIIDNHGFKRVSFSDQLKIIANKIYPWLPVEFEDWKDKDEPFAHPSNPTGLTPREVWVNFIDPLREVDPELFVHGAVEQVMYHLNRDENVIITDLRKEVEYEALKPVVDNVVWVVAGEREYVTGNRDEDNMDRWDYDNLYLNYRSSVNRFAKLELMLRKYL